MLRRTWICGSVFALSVSTVWATSRELFEASYREYRRRVRRL